jgi:hypothetical protein
MALGPRLDLRQSQSLVMTPQLRQAIKLLQSSNLEVTAFVEEELERNPLLERDERPEPRTAADERAPEAAAAEPADSHAAASSDSIPAESAAPLDAEWDNVYDPDSGFRSGAGAGGRTGFDEELGTIEDFADARISLREHLAEQIRLSFSSRSPMPRSPARWARRRRRSPACARGCSASTPPACSAATSANASPCSSPTATASTPAWRRCSTTWTCWRGATCAA